MNDATKVVVRRGSGSSLAGSIWFIGWLFTLGYLKLTFWKGLLAVIVWPYFIGTALRGG